MLTGFTGKFDDVPVQVPLVAESDGGGGSSGDAGGGDGAGAGGSLGQFLNTIVRVERSDGSLLGEAVTDNTKGMVDLPGFFGPLISRRMAPIRRGANEKESIHRRADGHDLA